MAPPPLSVSSDKHHDDVTVLISNCQARKVKQRCGKSDVMILAKATGVEPSVRGTNGAAVMKQNPILRKVGTDEGDHNRKGDVMTNHLLFATKKEHDKTREYEERMTGDWVRLMPTAEKKLQLLVSKEFDDDVDCSGVGHLLSARMVTKKTEKEQNQRMAIPKTNLKQVADAAEQDEQRKMGRTVLHGAAEKPELTRGCVMKETLRRPKPAENCRTRGVCGQRWNDQRETYKRGRSRERNMCAMDSRARRTRLSVKGGNDEAISLMSETKRGRDGTVPLTFGVEFRKLEPTSLHRVEPKEQRQDGAPKTRGRCPIKADAKTRQNDGTDPTKFASEMPLQRNGKVPHVMTAIGRRRSLGAVAGLCFMTK